MTDSSMISVLIVDDEWLSRSKVRQLLQQDPHVTIIGECANGNEAFAAIRQLKPDIAFMDMQMPGMNGMEVIEALGASPLPVLVFITAYDKYALQAFEVCALDYILKPMDPDRFLRTLDRAKSAVLQRCAASLTNMAGALSPQRATPLYSDRIVVRSNGNMMFYRCDDVDYVEAEGNRVRIHIGKETYSIREGINHLQQRLDPARFMRIHRSLIVNVDRIAGIQPRDHGDYKILLKTGLELLFSRSYRDNLRRLMDRISA